MTKDVESEKELVDSLGQLAFAVNRLTAGLLEVQHHQFALIAALANQPQVDRGRLAQDFVTTLRMLEIDLDTISPVLEAILTALNAPNEGSTQPYDPCA